MAFIYALLAVLYVGLAFATDTTFGVTCDIVAALCWTACFVLKVSE